MRQFPRWGYLLYMAALYPVGVFYSRDLILPFIEISLIFGVAIYRALMKTDRKRWLLPSGLALALFLSGLHYTTNILFFPHSPRAAHYLSDACLVGPVYAFGGLLFGALISLIGNASPETMP